MKQIPGVRISVYQGDDSVGFSEDGSLGSLTREHILLRVDVADGCNAHVITVDGKKNVVPKKRLGIRSGSSGYYCQLKLSVQCGEAGELYVSYPANNLRVVRFLNHDPEINFVETGVVWCWEVSVVSQRGEFFLCVQESYRAEAFVDENGKRVYPSFARWPQMNDFLVEALPTQMTLRPLGEYVPEPASVVADPLPGYATVMWFNEAQGFGCLKTSDGQQVRVHWSQLPPRPRRAFLKAGEQVVVSDLRKPVTAEGERPTAFALEAIGVSLS